MSTLIKTGAVLQFFATFLFVSSAQASPIPILDEFLIAQQFHVDGGLDTQIATIFDLNGELDLGASMHYEGNFNFLPPDSLGNVSGSYSGILTGNYLGNPWENTYSADMIGTVDPITGDPLEFTLTSSGKWGDSSKIPVEKRGKSFTDTGKIKTNDDGTATVEITITTGSEVDTGKGTFKQKKKDNKLTVTGDYEIEVNGKKYKESLKIVLDQVEKTYASELKSAFGLVTVLENNGTFTSTTTPGGETFGSTSFNVTLQAVPEPSTYILMTTGFGILAFHTWRRGKKNEQNPRLVL